MAFLDDILLGNRSARNRRSFIDSLEESKVVNLSDSGIQFSMPDNKASTALARDVLLETIGYVPKGFGMTAGAPIAFEKDSNTAALLEQAGIRKGTSLDQVNSALNGEPLFSLPEQTSSNLTQFLNGLLSGSTSTNDEGGSVTTPVQDYLNAYSKGTNAGLPDDLKAIVSFLDETGDSFDDLIAPRRSS